MLLAIRLSAAKKYAEARAVYQDVAERCERVFGLDDPRTQDFLSAKARDQFTNPRSQDDRSIFFVRGIAGRFDEHWYVRGL